jgi:hypothetical protein
MEIDAVYTSPCRSMACSAKQFLLVFEWQRKIDLSWSRLSSHMEHTWVNLAPQTRHFPCYQCVDNPPSLVFLYLLHGVKCAPMPLLPVPETSITAPVWVQKLPGVLVKEESICCFDNDGDE